MLSSLKPKLHRISRCKSTWKGREVTKRNTQIGIASFQDAERFCHEGSTFGFLVASNGEVAHLRKEVFINAGFRLDELQPETRIEVEVFYNTFHQRWSVVRVIALHQPQSAAPAPYLVEQFGDLRPALLDGKHVNTKTKEGLYGVYYDRQDTLLYFLVVKDGQEEVERFVHSTDLKEGLEAIFKGEAVRRRLSAVTPKKVLAQPAPTNAVKVDAPKPVAKPKQAAVPKLVTKPKPIKVMGFADLAAALEAKDQPGDQLNTTH